MKSSTTQFIAVLISLFWIAETQALEMSTSIKEYIKKATVTEFGYPSGTEQEVAEFTNFLKTNKTAVLAEFDTIAPDERRQNLIVAGAEFLPGTDYVSFLSGLLDKYQAGKVKKSVVIEAMSPSGKKYGFLAFNYQNSTVRSLCERAKTLLPADASFQQLMTEVLSGEQRKQIGASLFMENRSQPEILP